MTTKSEPLRVFWATDGSDHSESAIPLLQSIIMPVAEHVTVMTVAPQTLLGGVRVDPAFLSKVTPASRRAALQDAEAVAERWLLQLDPGPVPASATSRWGHPVHEILKGARSTGADLVVLGAKGHSNLHLLVLGSVAQGVAQLTTQPLLVARPGAGPVRRILVGHDDSPPSRKAVQFLSRLSLAPNTVITLLNVLAKAAGGKKGARSDGLDAAAQRLDAAAEALRTSGLEVKTEVAYGDAARVLRDIARKEKADLVVVGSRKPSTSAHYLIGSTAEKLVRHAQSSVLVVR